MKETKVILSLIYRNYFLDTKEKASNMENGLNDLKEKDIKKDMTIVDKDINDVFNERKKKSQKLDENFSLTQNKIIWYEKLLQNIVKMFRKNKD